MVRTLAVAAAVQAGDPRLLDALLDAAVPLLPKLPEFVKSNSSCPFRVGPIAFLTCQCME